MHDYLNHYNHRFRHLLIHSSDNIFNLILQTVWFFMYTYAPVRMKFFMKTGKYKKAISVIYSINKGNFHENNEKNT